MVFFFIEKERLEIDGGSVSENKYFISIVALSEEESIVTHPQSMGVRR
jgi:hypothetical protein